MAPPPEIAIRVRGLPETYCHGRAEVRALGGANVAIDKGRWSAAMGEFSLLRGAGVARALNGGNIPAPIDDLVKVGMGGALAAVASASLNPLGAIRAPATGLCAT